MNPAPADSGEHRFDLSGGALCLDFANTVGDRPEGRQEHLGGYADLLAWARQAGVLDAAGRETLARAAERSPAAAGRAFRRALAFREVLYRLFSALAAGHVPGTADLDALNRGLRRSLPHLAVAPAGEADFVWSWRGAPDRLDRPLWPVARSAAELLTSEQGARVKECASGRCSWLFVDRSRGRRRRWCDMKSCGNRAKARRHYRRKRAAARD